MASFWKRWLGVVEPPSGVGSSGSAGDATATAPRTVSRKSSSATGVRLKSWAGWPVLFVPAAAVAFDGCGIAVPGGTLTHYVRIAMACGLVTFVVWMFFQAFCTPLPCTQVPSEDDLLPMVRFAYLVTFLGLIAPAVPVFFPLIPQSTDEAMLRSPIGLVKGCVHSDHASSTWELACDTSDPFKLQWFVNIGGAARPYADAAVVVPIDWSIPPTR